MPIVSRLPHRLGIVLPSRDRRARLLPPRKRAALVAILIDAGMELVVGKETS